MTDLPLSLPTLRRRMAVNTVLISLAIGFVISATITALTGLMAGSMAPLLVIAIIAAYLAPLCVPIISPLLYMGDMQNATYAAAIQCLLARMDTQSLSDLGTKTVRTQVYLALLMVAGMANIVMGALVLKYMDLTTNMPLVAFLGILGVAVAITLVQAQCMRRWVGRYNALTTQTA